MSDSISSPKPRAFTKWLDAGTTPVAAVDQSGRLQYFNDAFAPFLQPAAPELLRPELLPPAESWNGQPCRRQVETAHFSSPSETPADGNMPHLDIAIYQPLTSKENSIFGCLISLHSSTTALQSDALANGNTTQPITNAASDRLQQELLEFRKRWSDATHLDVLCGDSALIRKIHHQVQLAISCHNAPLLIRGSDLNACHDLAKGIWLQRFKRSQISSAGFQFMPISARAMDGDMLRSALDLALPLTMHGDYLETCVLLEDLSALQPGAKDVLAEWLSTHRPPQIFATERVNRETANTQLSGNGFSNAGLHNAELNSSITQHTYLDQYLGVFVIEIPSLQSRPEDIPAIATRILNQSQTTNRNVSFAFSNNAIDALVSYPWNGDLTELRTLIRSINLPPNKFVVDVADLPLALRSYIGGKATPTIATTTIDLDQALLELEKSLLEKTLSESRGNRALTARKLGISRARLLRRLAQLNIVASESDSAIDSEFEPETTKPVKPIPSEENPKANTLPEEFSPIDFIPVDDDDSIS